MTSTDRIHWSRNQSNPILVADQSWEGSGIYYATVHQENNRFVMYYMNSSGTGFGEATSSDGINWIKDNKNPFFTNEDTHDNWANYKIAYPFYSQINDQDRIYYTGFDFNNIYRIGFMTK